MKGVRTAIDTLLAISAVNCHLAVCTLGLEGGAAAAVYVLAALILGAILWAPAWGPYPSRRLRILDGGWTLLLVYLIVTPVSLGGIAWSGMALLPEQLSPAAFAVHCGIVLLSGGLLLLAGGLRVLGTSVQLGIAWRLVMALCWWIPGMGYVLAWKACAVAAGESRFELDKCELDRARAEREVCRTRYPILLVHGVFFRDSRLFNYWGRIPAELIRNGARIYYGQQQSAASVADSAAELKARIEEIVRETGCGKVNILAHSKGGLDARYAISRLGAAPMVASLTTINTPHRGCLFAERLLEQTPAAFQNRLAAAYNRTLRRLGDPSPDFLAAVRDLTASACQARNAATPDSPDVLYESVGSYVRKARSGRFPLNVSYRLVKHYDGENDGLVAVEAAKWGSRFTLLEPAGRRGISHADVIDLGRENIPGFDVREFYVELVQRLRDKGC